MWLVTSSGACALSEMIYVTSWLRLLKVLVLRGQNYLTGRWGSLITSGKQAPFRGGLESRMYFV